MPPGPGGRFDDRGGSGRPGGGDKNITKAFPLKHIKAADVAEKLSQVLTGRGVKVVAYEPANSVLVTGDAATLEQLHDVIEKMLAEADVKPAPGGKGSDPKAGPGSAPGGPPRTGPLGGPPSGAPPGVGSAGGPPTPGGPAVPATLTVYPLKHAKAAELAEVVKKVFAAQGVEVTADPRTNKLIVRSDDDTVPALRRIIEQLDVESP
jgi:hypothetical protein